MPGRGETRKAAGLVISRHKRTRLWLAAAFRVPPAYYPRQVGRVLVAVAIRWTITG